MSNLLKNQVDLFIELLDESIINEAQFNEAMQNLAEHRFSRNPKRPCAALHILLECKNIDEPKIFEFLVESSALPTANLLEESFYLELFELIPLSIVYNYGLVIFKQEKQGLCMGVLNPLDLELCKQVALFLNKPLRFFLVRTSEFTQFIKQNYRT